MSRYHLVTHNPDMEIWIGWDTPLETFFAQVFRSASHDDEDACLLWRGTATQELPTVEALQAVLAPWVTLSTVLQAQLRREQATAVPPTRLQRRMREVGEEVPHD